MRKLLTASLLLAGCALQPALAQQATTAPVKTQATEPAQVPDWVAAEFGEAYGRYFLDLPDFYRYNVSQVLRNTPLADPRTNKTSTLAQYTALREAVYQTIYQYCHALKYGIGDSQEVARLVYLMLYQDLHLSNLAASHLAPYISSRYQQPAPPPQYSAYPAGLEAPDKLATGQLDRTTSQATYPQAYGRTTTAPEAPISESKNASGLDASGWRFATTPVVEALDDSPGFIRFKIKISDKGEIESVTKVAGNVSPTQERLCRNKLLDAQFVKTNSGASGATGFYTFRFSVR